MKGEGLLQCLKKDSRTKNKWITVYQAAQACPRSNSYIKDRLNEFAEKLPEVDRKEECSCKTLYYVDPPDEVYKLDANLDLFTAGIFVLSVSLIILFTPISPLFYQPVKFDYVALPIYRPANVLKSS